MDKKFLLLTILTFLLLPQLVSADLFIPLSIVTLPLIPLIILIEASAFWFLANKVVRVPVGFRRLILVTFVANIATSSLGFFIPYYPISPEDFIYPEYWIVIGTTFILSVFIEWGVYTSFFVNIKTRDLLKISFVVNLISYAITYPMLASFL